jgi:hypothetical protein
MYHYPAQNGIPDITLVETGELTQGQGPTVLGVGH